MKNTIKSSLKSSLKLSLAAMAISGVVATNVALAGTVTVSNYPLALLSKAVTKGNHDAQVLLGAGDVGHHGSLAPSKVKLVEDSDFVVWFGADLEQNLVKTLDKAPNAISLLQFNAFTRYPQRNIDGTAKPDTLDPHIWLDPTNAKAIVMALAVIHGHANPDAKEEYQKNAQAFIEAMDEISTKVAAPTPVAYWAYHDAYQYLESSAGLRFAGALTPDHHLNPKASQFKLLNSTRPTPQMCLVSQGPVSDGIKNKLGNVTVTVQQEDMSGGEADFIGAWQALVTSIQQCVNAK